MTEPKKAKRSGFTGWLQDALEPLVRAAVNEAVQTLHDDIKGDLVNLETHMIAQFTQLPGMVASQVEHVALDVEQVAERVAQRFGDFLNPGGLAEDVANRTGGILGNLVNPGAIASQVIDGILPHFPHFPGFGFAGGGVVGDPGHQGSTHETTAGTSGSAQASEDFLQRAKQIREEMEKTDIQQPAPESQRKSTGRRSDKAAEIRRRLAERDGRPTKETHEDE